MEPPYWQPYLIEVCLARSSAFFIGVDILVIVRNAAKFAVYEDIRMRVKNAQTPAMILVELALGATSLPATEHVTLLYRAPYNQNVETTTDKHKINCRHMRSYTHMHTPTDMNTMHAQPSYRVHMHGQHSNTCPTHTLFKHSQVCALANTNTCFISQYFMK